MQKKNCTVTYSQGQGCKPRKLLGSRRCWQFSFDWRICLALKGHGYYTLGPWPSGLWRSHLRFYREVTEAWSLEEEHAILHHPSQPGSCKMETVEIHVAPQGMSVGLKCLNLEACSSLARGITKTGMHHFPWSLLSSLTLIYGSSFTLQFFLAFILIQRVFHFQTRLLMDPVLCLCASDLTWPLFDLFFIDITALTDTVLGLSNLVSSSLIAFICFSCTWPVIFLLLLVECCSLAVYCSGTLQGWWIPTQCHELCLARALLGQKREALILEWVWDSDLNAEGSMVINCKSLVIEEVPVRIVLAHQELPPSLLLTSICA